MNFFKRYILLRYTLLLLALLLPFVMFISYYYYNYRLNTITDEVVFSISTINKNTVNRYESMWAWKSMQSKNDRKKLSSKFRKELQYLSTVPFVICADFTTTDSKQILGAWPVPECSIIKKESTRVSTEIENGTTFNLYYNHLYPEKIAKGEIGTVITVISSGFLFLLSILVLANYLIISRPVKMIIQAISAYNKEHENFRIETKDLLGKTHNEQDEFGRIAETMTNHVIASEQYLKEIQMQRSQMVRDLEDARKLQDHILPKITDRTFPLGVMNRAAKGLSGDFYDFIDLGDNEFFFILADVSGKGVQASVVMVYALSIFRQEAMHSRNLKETIKKINYGIATNFEGLFITAVIGAFNILTQKTEFFNLGHNPPIFITEQGETKLFPASGIPLGIAKELDSNMKREEENLSRGRIFFYTDGFPETKQGGKEIGEEGLIEQIKLSIASSAQETTNNIMEQAIFNPEKVADDMTFMTLGPLR